jgi:hypothetical protein
MPEKVTNSIKGHPLNSRIFNAFSSWRNEWCTQAATRTPGASQHASAYLSGVMKYRNFSAINTFQRRYCHNDFSWCHICLTSDIFSYLSGLNLYMSHKAVTLFKYTIKWKSLWWNCTCGVNHFQLSVVFLQRPMTTSQETRDHSALEEFRTVLWISFVFKMPITSGLAIYLKEMYRL